MLNLNVWVQRYTENSFLSLLYGQNLVENDNLEGVFLKILANKYKGMIKRERFVWQG